MRAAGELEVVVEAVGDRRADRVLGAREQVGDGLGHHVRGGVAQHLPPVVGVGRDDRDVCVVLDRPVEVVPVVVDPGRERRLRRAGGRSRSATSRGRGAALDPARASVGQRDRDVRHLFRSLALRAGPLGPRSLRDGIPVPRTLAQGEITSALSRAPVIARVGYAYRERPARSGAARSTPRSSPSSRSTAGRRGIVAAREDRAGEVVERLERRRRVEVVVDGVAHALGEGSGIGAVGALGRGEQAVQQRGALVEIGVVPLEAGAVVVAHQREPDRARVGPS